MQFEKRADYEFRDEFVRILTKGSKNNTYKFALARFLLDYSNEYESDKVRYTTIAKYFFKYYWLQECKSKLRQGPKNQEPEIIPIIRKEFTKNVYPQTFAELEKEEPGKIQRCIKQITKKCFDDVIPRFQNTKNSKEMFFKYLAKEYKDSSDNKKIDPGGGILLNRDAMHFFRDNYVTLYKVVILEWIRFLEIRNFGTPNLVRKIESDGAGPRDQGKFRRHLESFTDSSDCFYCTNRLEPGRKTHVDHVIPFDYIGDTELWNMVLSCHVCNCEKSGNLPPRSYIDKLLERNSYHQSDKKLQDSLDVLNHGQHDVVWHYKNAQKHGYVPLKKFPKKRAA